MVARGDVCIIPNCKEFFIATAGASRPGCCGGVHLKRSPHPGAKI